MSVEGLKNMHANLRKQADRLDKYVKYWIPLLGLEAWHFTIDYHGQLREDDSKTTGCISCSWEYMNGHIDFYLPKFEGMCDIQAEHIVVHELVHALLNELKPEVRTTESQKHEEHAVSHISKAFVVLREDTREKTEKAIAKAAPKKRKR